MAPFTLERTQRIAADPAELTAFFESPRNLERITPPWLRFRIRSCTDDPVREGTRISYRLRINGLPVRWESLITEYDPGRSFTDTMLRGPYRRWVHRHDFRVVGGGVDVIDRVEYELPLGVVGRLVHHLWVRRQVEDIFAYRAKVIAELFEGGT